MALRAATFWFNHPVLPKNADDVSRYLRDQQIAIDQLIRQLSANTSPISLLNMDLSGLKVGTAYSGGIIVSGGQQPYTFVVTSGTVPDGLALSPAGTLAGTPTAADTTAFTVMATDFAGHKGVQTYTATVTL